jgi:putative ABC transport system permease protein
MIKNYLKTAYRSLLKNKGFTLLNVLGLSIGLATCLLIVFYVKDELGYDKYNVNADRIFTITDDVKLNGTHQVSATTEAPLLESLKGNYSQIEKSTRLMDPKEALFASPNKFYFRKGNENILEKKIILAESSIFDVFTLPMLYGKPQGALDEPHTTVITESTALKYFGQVNVVGRMLTVNDTINYKITGVTKDVPSQSHFHYDFLLSFASFPESHVKGWGYCSMHNYLLLKPGTDTKSLAASIQNIEIKNSFSSSAWTTNGNYLHVILTPLLNIHLHSDASYSLEKGGSIMYVYIFSAIAILVLVIACVNFMNLSTARSSNRAKEVGVRKVLGSARTYIIAQFLTESMLVTLASAVIALTLAWVLLPLFNNMANKQLAITAHTLLWLLPAMFVIVLVVGALAGSYPAFYLSAFQPITVLKGKVSAGFKNSFLRSFLVVFQFVISIALIICTMVIYNQLKYINNKNLGFDRNQVLVIKNTNVLGKQAKVLKDEIKQMPGVQNATMSLYQPTGDERLKTGLFPDRTIDIKKDVLTEFWSVDENYINTMGLKLINGRNFSKDIASDSAAMIVNEAFVQKYGAKDPLNKTLYRDSYGIQPYHIIGVVKDFNFESLHSEVRPLALYYTEDDGAISIRLHTADLTGLMTKIASKWKQFSPNQQFSYSFMDQDFDATYRTEQRTGTIFICFTTLAILIACLGLFGLAAYAAEQRNKEIGIRKVLGASVSGIVSMLSMDFIKLVFISIIIASPVAWWAMNKWLENFAYRMNIQWWIIALAGFTALFIAFVTISFQSIRAAMMNPVKSLRSE